MTIGEIRDFALIGDQRTAALVGFNGTIAWLCWPRFDSEACMASLVAGESAGDWSIAPVGSTRISRRYRPDTLILETLFESEAGQVRLVDFMPLAGDVSSIVRIVACERGRVAMHVKLSLRFDYGRLRPWTHSRGRGVFEAIAGPHTVVLESAVEVSCRNSDCISSFTLSAGERTAFVLRYGAAHLAPPEPLDAERALATTEAEWRDWASRCTYEGPWREAVIRSLVTIKALTSRSTGGIIAAPTMSLPEHIGGSRNWDYRYCWLRDSTFTLLAMMHGGYHREAAEWRDWLLRAVAGMLKDIQPVYGVAGDHRLPEWEVDWLAGYLGSKPVRVGNKAFQQFQLDVYGEIIDVLFQARAGGIAAEDWSWQLQRALVEKVEESWQLPDAGIWEVRHGRERFTHSRVMAWVALDRAVRAGEHADLNWPLERWRTLRNQIRRDVDKHGYDADLGTFVRSYETRVPDASALLFPLVGFVPADDPRMLSTVRRIESDLIRGGLVRRYDTEKAKDGMSGTEGAFLACSFWYVDNLVLQGREDEANEKFEELLKIRNDVGFLSEECDPNTRELLGNFPQVFSHLALVNSAYNLAHPLGPARARSAGADASPRTTPGEC